MSFNNLMSSSEGDRPIRNNFRIPLGPLSFTVGPPLCVLSTFFRDHLCLQFVFYKGKTLLCYSIDGACCQKNGNTNFLFYKRGRKKLKEDGNKSMNYEMKHLTNYWKSTIFFFIIVKILPVMMRTANPVKLEVETGLIIVVWLVL